MKFKFLSIIIAFAAALAFTTCDSKQASKSSDSSKIDSSKIEQADEKSTSKEDVALNPTGDVTTDAKQALEETIAVMKSDIKSIEDAKKLEESIDDIQDKYEDFYKAKGEAELKKFQEERNKQENAPEFRKKLQEAGNIMLENTKKVLEDK